MWARCGYFFGTVKPGCEAEFDAAWDGFLADAIRAYPGVRSFRLFRSRRREPGCPGIYQMTELRLESQAAIEVMLASPERAANLARVKDVLALFEGKVVHIDYQITAER
jgi:antibiotic biosynthesis monooxygenase (ABM) superfamily enzyme